MKAVIFAPGSERNVADLDSTLRWLQQQDLHEVAVVTSGQVPPAQVAAGQEQHFAVHWVQMDEDRGTAGAAKDLADFLDRTFVVVSAGRRYDVDLAALHDYHRRRSALVTIGLIHVDEPRSHYMVECDSMGEVNNFLVRPATWTSEQRTASAGLYIAEPEVFDHIPDDRRFDWEEHLFPLLVAGDHPLYGQILDGTVVELGAAGDPEQQVSDAIKQAAEQLAAERAGDRPREGAE